MNATSKIIIAILVIGLITSLAVNMQQQKDHKDIKKARELKSAAIRKELTNAKEELTTAERNLFMMREIQYVADNSMINATPHARTISTRIDSVFLNIGSSLDSINQTLQRIDSLER
jgi:mannitol-specific phosphotransferase system IIBC component